MTDSMVKANCREKRVAFKAFSYEEKEEAVKECPSEILINELLVRLDLKDKQISSIEEILRCKR